MYPIGKLSLRTGCKVETIRYYERIGVLPHPGRTTGGHRLYTEDHLKRLNFVLRARGLGFPLGTVRVLLDLADGEDQSCAEAEQIASERLAEIRNKISDLATLENVLEDMVRRCRGGTLPQCPLIEALFEGPPADHGDTPPASA